MGIKRSFDYATAWREVTKPAFDALPVHVRALYFRVCAESRECGQDTTLATVWPKDAPDGCEPLRAAFESVSSEDLAVGAHVIHSFGHLAPSALRDLALGPMGIHIQTGASHGAYWKFASYVDQVLAPRLGLRSRFERDSGSGRSIRIIDGLLRVHFQTPDSWQWVEVAPATEANLASLKDAPWPAYTYSRTRPDNWSLNSVRLAEQYRSILWPKTGPLAGFRFLVECYTRQECPRCDGRGETFESYGHPLNRQSYHRVHCFVCNGTRYVGPGVMAEQIALAEEMARELAAEVK